MLRLQTQYSGHDPVRARYLTLKLNDNNNVMVGPVIVEDLRRRGSTVPIFIDKSSRLYAAVCGLKVAYILVPLQVAVCLYSVSSKSVQKFDYIQNLREGI